MATQKQLYASVTEKQFQQQVLQAAEWTGWLVYHVFDSRKVTSAGYPDLTLVHPEGTKNGKQEILYWELKTEKGRVSKQQKIWIDALLANGQEAGVIRPSDIDAVIVRLKRGKK